MLLNEIVFPELARVIVDVPEIQEDGQIIISEFNAKMALDFNDMIINREKGDSEHIDFMTMLICASAIKEDGSPLLDIRSHKQLSIKLDFPVLNRLYTAAAELNGFTAKSVDISKKRSRKRVQSAS